MSQAVQAPAVRDDRPQDVAATDGRPSYELIELFFFAYRDFVADADRMLAEYGFGRAHHRVLHFVSRRPGLRVTDLLDVLRITKQSLNRVLKELIETGFVEQRPGPTDRRQRLLHATPVGAALAHELALTQTRRIARALHGAETLGPEGLDRAAARFLLGMIDPADRTRVRRIISGLSVPGRGPTE